MQTDRIVRPSEAVILTGRSLASIWRDEQAGKFPKRIRLGENAVGYRMSDIQAWLDSCEVIEPGTAKVVAPGAKRGRKANSGGAI
ncbi:MAG TPA: AlpA family phage regulatory protein [Syntrophales bacterium]|nr:AlpA family phage regulatory protein [Syntrophales bacterium]